jgi:hypothetical protein
MSTKRVKAGVRAARIAHAEASLSNLNDRTFSLRSTAEELSVLPAVWNQQTQHEVNVLSIELARHLEENPEDYSDRLVRICQEQLFRLSVHPWDYAIACFFAGEEFDGKLYKDGYIASIFWLCLTFTIGMFFSILAAGLIKSLANHKPIVFFTGLFAFPIAFTFGLPAWYRFRIYG